MAVNTNEKCKATKNNFVCTLKAGHQGEHLSAGGTWWRPEAVDGETRR